MYRIKTKKEYTISNRKAICTVTEKAIQRKFLCLWIDVKTYEIENWKDREGR